jgi:glycosyltransferase involved in cell wall biosynthesis
VTEAAKFPLVSVLIPCYNAERWLAATLDSVAAQTWPSLEVIVVDDGSTDGSREVLRRYEDKVTVIRQENRGQPAALNRALAAAHGDFIQYLDADDLLAPDKIALQMAQLLQRPGWVSVAAWARFRSDPGEAVFPADGAWPDLEPVDWLVRNWRDGGGMMYPAMWLLPRGVVDAAGPWHEALTLANDTEYFARIVLASQGVAHCAAARTYYRSSVPGSMSGTKTRKGWESNYRVLELCQQHLRGRDDSESARHACAMLWQRFAHAAYPYAPDLANRALAQSRLNHPARLQPEGGPAFHWVRRILGWKLARRMQRWSGRA